MEAIPVNISPGLAVETLGVAALRSQQAHDDGVARLGLAKVKTEYIIKDMPYGKKAQVCRQTVTVSFVG